MPILQIQDKCTECDRMRIYLSKKKIQYDMEINTNHHILVLRDKTVQGIKNLIDFMTGDNIKVEHCEF